MPLSKEQRRKQVLKDVLAKLLEQKEHDLALALMETHPFLAKEKEVSLRDHSAFPLFHFVRNGAPLEIVQKVCELHPDAVKYRKGLCLHEACRRRQEDVVLFLVKKFPQALTECQPFGDYDDSLVHFLVTGSYRWLSTATIKAMLDMWPASHSCETEYGCLPFISALGQGTQNPELLDFLEEKFPRDYFYFHLEEEPNEAGIQRIIRLLPQLSKLNVLCLSMDHWSTDIAGSVLHATCSLRFLRDLHIRLPETEAGQNHQQFYTILEETLRVTSAWMRSFDLTGARTQNFLRAGQRDDLIFPTIAAGLKNSKRLRSLVLEDIHISEGSALTQFIANGGAPGSVFLRRVSFGDGSWTPQISCAKKSRMVSITCQGDLPYVQPLCSQLVTIAPKLKTFHSSSGRAHNPKMDLTGCVIDLLKIPALEFIEIHDGTGDISKICEALERNNTLTTYGFAATLDEEWKQSCLLEVLKKHNTTLESLQNKFFRGSMPLQGETYDRIMYWTNLNKFGRKKARDPATLAPVFVGLLQNSHSVNITYGLLREMPGLWSTYSLPAQQLRRSRRKRKRINA